MPSVVELTIEHGDALEIDVDILCLKYAQRFYGVDKAVRDRLEHVGISHETLEAPDGDFRFTPTHGSVRARYALYLGGPGSNLFRYAQIREFSDRALSTAKQVAPLQARSIAMTIHGVGFGLDEVEGVRAQFAGMVDALQRGDYPPALERILIVERDKRRVERLRKALDPVVEVLELTHYARRLSSNRWGFALKGQEPGSTSTQDIEPVLPNVGQLSEDKPSVFVAISFDTKMDDIYAFGIEDPVHTLGLLCERMDIVPFTGSVVERLKQRIKSSQIVIVELTEAPPNVYLEVGYAWGVECETILVVHKEEEVHFDVGGQRLIKYERIFDLRDALWREMIGLGLDYRSNKGSRGD